MKKLILSAVAMMFASAFFAQTGRGAIVTSAYYGFPNIEKSILEIIVEDAVNQAPNNQANVQVTGFGPSGARGEFFVTDRVSVGLDFVVNTVGINFNGIATDSMGNQSVYNYDFTSTRLGFLPYMNYHFIENSPVDFFMHFGVGYKTRTIRGESNDPNFDFDGENGAILPIAFRFGFGVRYFFTPMIGAHFNVGLGHSGLANTGLTFSF